MASVHIINNDRTIAASPAVSILNLLLREGHSISHLCGGKAQCGTCKIKVMKGAKFLSPMTEREKKRLGKATGVDTGKGIAAEPAGESSTVPNPRKEAGTESVGRPVVRLACQTYCYGDISIKILAPGGIQ